MIRRLAGVLLFFAAGAGAGAASIVSGSFNASLNTGSLAGTMFPVLFSYDASQVTGHGDDFVQLASFNFTLLGVPFTRDNIFQGGQVIFRNGVLDNVTASFQVFLPPNSPVKNITFGFGGPESIAYIDPDNQFGKGSFTFVSEPSSLVALPMALASLVCYGRIRGKTQRRDRLRGGGAEINS